MSYADVTLGIENNSCFAMTPEYKQTGLPICWVEGWKHLFVHRPDGSVVSTRRRILFYTVRGGSRTTVRRTGCRHSLPSQSWCRFSILTRWRLFCFLRANNFAGIGEATKASGGSKGDTSLRSKIFSKFSCNFSENVTKLYVGVPSPEGQCPLLQGILDLPLKALLNGNNYIRDQVWLFQTKNFLLYDCSLNSF